MVAAAAAASEREARERGEELLKKKGRRVGPREGRGKVRAVESAGPDVGVGGQKSTCGAEPPALQRSGVDDASART